MKLLQIWLSLIPFAICDNGWRGICCIYHKSACCRRVLQTVPDWGERAEMMEFFDDIKQFGFHTAFRWAVFTVMCREMYALGLQHLVPSWEDVLNWPWN